MVPKVTVLVANEEKDTTVKAGERAFRGAGQSLPRRHPDPPLFTQEG